MNTADLPDMPEEFEPVVSDKPLTFIQQRWVEEMLIEPNFTKAAVRAGYAKKYAGKNGSDNYKKPHIRAALERARKKLALESGITPMRVLQEIAMIAFSDANDVRVGPNGRLDADFPEARRAVQEIQVEYHDPPKEMTAKQRRAWKPTVRRGKIRLYDKRQALVNLAEHLGLLSPDMPPLEVMLNRLPPKVAMMLRRMIGNPEQFQEPTPAEIADQQAREAQRFAQPPPSPTPPPPESQ